MTGHVWLQITVSVDGIVAPAAAPFPVQASQFHLLAKLVLVVHIRQTAIVALQESPYYSRRIHEGKKFGGRYSCPDTLG